MEVPTVCFWPIFQAYVIKGIYPQNMALYGTVPPF